MKTVMKKMFSLLLVAVLLVGIMPFQAFADEPHAFALTGLVHGETYTVNEEFVKTHSSYTGNSKDFWVQWGNSYGLPFTADQSRIADGTIAADKYVLHVNDKCYPSHSYVAATCTEPKTCSVCDTTEGEALGHSWDDATCTEPKTCSVCDTTEGEALGHGTANEEGNCPTCGICLTCEKKPCDCPAPTPTPTKATVTIYAKDSNAKNYTTGKTFEIKAGTKSAKEICDAANYTEKTVRSYSVTDENGGNKCTREETITLTAGAKYLLWLETAPVSESTPNPGTGDNNDTNTGDDNTTDDNNDPDPLCTKCGGAHDVDDCTNNGNYNLKVYVTLWTGDGREDTYYLHTFKGLSTNTYITDYIHDNVGVLINKLEADHPGYELFDERIYENKWSTDSMENTDRMGYSDQEAYINAKRPSKDVVIFIHTGRTYVDYDWIKVEGKTTGDTLTLDEAKDIVKKYYNFNNLKMYDNDDWNEYVDGNDNIKPWTAVPISDYNVTKIHVLMSGYSSKNNSGSNSGYTADSTNPKTGDMIYAPAIIMGASVSALAVLFYLNKKRAF